MQLIVACFVLFAVAASVSATVPTSYSNYCGAYGTPICDGCKCAYCYEYDSYTRRCVDKTTCSKDCGNCGKCVCNKHTGFEECQCTVSGFEPPDCKTGPCKKGACNSPVGGSCQVDLVKCEKKCNCKPCYEGDQCQSRKDRKSSDECKKLGCKCGECKCDATKGLHCACDDGFKGVKCDQSGNNKEGPCKTAPCHKDGTQKCVNVYKNNQCTYECVCNNCYKGTKCDQRKDRSGGECDHFGCKCGDCKCNDCTGDLFCECKNGFKGTKCAQSDNNAKGKCPGGWSAIGSKCFKFVNVQKTWDEARSDCNLLGGKLATINNIAENNFAYGLTNKGDTWIGLNDKGAEDKFRWADTKRCPTFLNWFNGEPSNSNNEDCVHFLTASFPGNNKQWSDKQCGFKFPYVCELSTGQCKGSSCSTVGGTCTNDVATCGDKCECKECYKGPNCDQHVCEHYECHCGHCVCEYGVAKCKCDKYWYGPYCKQGGPCKGHNCPPNWKCAPVGKCGYRCINPYG